MRSGLSRLSTPSMAAGAIVSAFAILLGVLVVRSDAETSLSQRLGDGAAWLASTEIGGVSLLDGASGTSATDLVVTTASNSFDVVQWGPDALIVNTSLGTIGRIDGATWRVATGHRPFAEPDTMLELVAGIDNGWVITDGLISSVQLTDLQTLGRYAIGETVTSAAANADGTLFFASDNPTASLQSVNLLDDSPQSVDGPLGNALVVPLGHKVAAISTRGQTVWVEGEGTVCNSLPYPADTTLLANGGAELLAMVSDAGRFLAWNPQTSGCPDPSSVVDLGPGTYGQPVLADDWGLIPEYDESVVYLFDDSGDSIKRIKLDNIPPATSFELIQEAGHVWYNVTESDAAGLVRRDGTVVALSKYAEGDDGFSLAPVDASEETLTPEVAGATLERDGTTTTSVDTRPTTTIQALGVTTTTAPAEGVTTTAPDASETTTTALPPDQGGTTTTAPPTPVTVSPSDGLTPPTTDQGTTTSTTTPSNEDTIAVVVEAGAQQSVVGEPVTFSARTVTGQPTRYSWSVQPSATIASQTSRSTSISFAQTGNFIVAVEACDAANHCATARSSFQVVADQSQVPLVAAIVGDSSVLVGESVALSDGSQGDPTSWAWDLDGGSPSTATSPRVSVRWSTPGTKTVTLTVERDGVQSSDTHQVVVTAPTSQPAPFAISCSPTALEVGASAFCALSGTSSDFSGLRWSASNGASVASSTGTDTNVTKSSAGTSVVTLRATDVGTGTDVSTTATLTFSPAVVAPTRPTISGPSTVTAGEASSFVVNGDNLTTVAINWTAPGATISGRSSATASITWPDPGTYQLEVSVDAVTATKTVTVEPAGSGGDPLVVTVTNPGAQETSFHMTIALNRCARLDWSLAGTGDGNHTQGNTSSDCRTSYNLAPYSNTTLAPDTTYQIRATLTEPDGTVTPWTQSITTASPMEPPQLTITGLAVSGTTVSATVSSDPCTTLYWWYSGTKSGEARHEDTFTDSACSTSRTITFEGRPGFSYGIQFNATDPTNGEVTTEYRTVSVPAITSPETVALTLSSASTTGTGFTVQATSSECAVITWAIDGVAGPSSNDCVTSYLLDSSAIGAFLPGTNHTVTATATRSPISASSATDTASIAVTTATPPPPAPDPTMWVAAVTETSFIIGASLPACATVTWSITETGTSASESQCLTDHQMGTSRVVSLAAGTTYTFTAAFTGADGQTTTKSLSVTTETPPVVVPPLVVSDGGVNAATASWSASTSQCATATGYWSEVGGAGASGTINIGDCRTAFTFQVPTPVSGATYVFRLTFSSTEGGGSQDASSPEFVYP